MKGVDTPQPINMTYDPLRGNKVEIALSSHPQGMSGFPLRTKLPTTGSVDTFKSIISCVWTFLSREDSPQEIARFYPLGSSALCLPLSKYMSSCFLSMSSSSSQHELGIEGTSGRGILQPRVPCCFHLSPGLDRFRVYEKDDLFVFLIIWNISPC